MHCTHYALYYHPLQLVAARELFAKTSGWEKEEKGEGAGEHGVETEPANGGNGGGEEVEREFVSARGVTVRIDVYTENDLNNRSHA
jgi:hypothetical protein